MILLWIGERDAGCTQQYPVLLNSAMTQKQINSVGHKSSRVLEQWMSGAVAVFININMLCKATVNSGYDVITPLKHPFSQASLSFLLLVITLQSLLRRFASLSLILNPKAITMTKFSVTWCIPYSDSRVISSVTVLKWSVYMHLPYLFTQPSLLLANPVENLSPESSLSVQFLCGRGCLLLHL